MNNDLISRSELRTAIGKRIAERHGYYSLRDIKDAIDNAPSVELRMGRMTNGVIIPIERPQGKWVRTGQSFINPNKFRNFCCSNCFWELDEHIRIEPNFCPNCGADMRGDNNGKSSS